MGQRLKAIWPPVLIAVLFLAAWEALVIIQEIKPYLLPAPTLIWENFTKDLTLMWSAAFYTGTTAFLGLVFGTIVAIVLAFFAQRIGIKRSKHRSKLRRTRTIPCVEALGRLGVRDV